MSEKQFDIFDEPFREAAGHYEPEFNEAAWKKMEAKLDGKPNRRRPFGWLWWFSDLIMITLVVTLLFELNGKTNPGNSGAVLPVNATTAKGQAPLYNSGENGTGEALPRTPTDVTVEHPVTHNQQSQVKETNDNVPEQSYLHSDRGENQKSLEDKKMAGRKPGFATRRKPVDNPAGMEEPEIMEKQAGQPVRTAPEGEMISNPANPVPRQEDKTQVDAQIQATIAPAEETTGEAHNVFPADKKVSPTAAPASPATGVVKPRMRPFRGFYIQAGLSPEWSFIAGNNPGPVTATYGVAAGYAFGNRWSVQTGIFSTQKNYKAGPGDYKAKPGSYYATVKIFSVDADCRVTELPILVNYQMLARGRQTLFATAGFASLIMKKETYDYHYERWNGMPAYSEHSYKTNAFHPFASMYLGAGYGYNLNENLSLSASPYLKVPLYGVGEGNVKITSAGMLFGLQYGISTRKNDKKAKAASPYK